MTEVQQVDEKIIINIIVDFQNIHNKNLWTALKNANIVENGEINMIWPQCQELTLVVLVVAC